MSSDSQPRRGFAGLLFVLPVAGALAAGFGGPAESAAVLAPVVTFALPVVAMIAFWWEDWPGSLARGGWSGLSDTAIVVVGGLLLAALGRVLVPGSGALALAGGIFTVMLQLTLVCERWPLNGLGFGPIWSGMVALVVCWVIGLAGYVLVVRSGLLPVAGYGAWLTAVGAWQMIFYVGLRGWPFVGIPGLGLRLVTGNVVVVALGWGSWVVGSAVSGAVIAAVLVVSMLFEGWPGIRLGVVPGRALVLGIVVVVAGFLLWVLPVLGRWGGVPGGFVDEWVTHATLNGLGLGVILHVAVWRRWPVL